MIIISIIIIMELIIFWYAGHLEGSGEFFPNSGRLSEEAAGCWGQLLVGGGAVREVQHLEEGRNQYFWQW